VCCICKRQRHFGGCAHLTPDEVFGGHRVARGVGGAYERRRRRARGVRCPHPVAAERVGFGAGPKDGHVVPPVVGAGQLGQQQKLVGFGQRARLLHVWTGRDGFAANRKRVRHRPPHGERQVKSPGEAEGRAVEELGFLLDAHHVGDAGVREGLPRQVAVARRHEHEP
jgi:hypothetical protein